MTALHYQSSKFYNAFAAFHPIAHVVIAEHYESHEFCNAFHDFDTFDSNAHLLMAEFQE